MRQELVAVMMMSVIAVGVGACGSGHDDASSEVATTAVARGTVGLDENHELVDDDTHASDDPEGVVDSDENFMEEDENFIEEVAPPAGVTCPTLEQQNAVATGSDGIDLYETLLPPHLGAQFRKILDENPQITEVIMTLDRNTELDEAQLKAFDELDEILEHPQYEELQKAMRWIDIECGMVD